MKPERNQVTTGRTNFNHLKVPVLGALALLSGPIGFMWGNSTGKIEGDRSAIRGTVSLYQFIQYSKLAQEERNADLRSKLIAVDCDLKLDGSPKPGLCTGTLGNSFGWQVKITGNFSEQFLNEYQRRVTMMRTEGSSSYPFFDVRAEGVFHKDGSFEVFDVNFRSDAGPRKYQ